MPRDLFELIENDFIEHCDTECFDSIVSEMKDKGYLNDIDRNNLNDMDENVAVKCVKLIDLIEDSESVDRYGAYVALVNFVSNEAQRFKISDEISKRREWSIAN